VTFGVNHQRTKKLENPAKNCNNTARYVVTSDIIQIPFTDIDGHLIKAFLKEQHDGASQ